MTRKQAINQMKVDWATYHYAHISKNVDDICKAVHISPDRLQKLMRTPYWEEALENWLQSPSSHGDLGDAEQLWTEMMIENGNDFSAVKYLDQPFKCAPTGNPAVYSLLNAHLFCADNLSEAEICQRLVKDGPPVQYDGQHLRGYHFFAFPNAVDGLYSKVFARVNVAGDLVVGRGEDTCLVCIKHGRLSVTRQVSDDVVNVSDKRLRLCL